MRSLASNCGVNRKNSRWAIAACLCLSALSWGQAQQQPFNPASATDSIQQGRSLLQSHDLPQARQVLEKAVHRNPSSAETWLLLADTYSQLGMEGEAIRGYETVLKLQANSPNALYNLAILQLRRNNVEEAARYLEAFHQQRPQDRDILFPLAHCLFQLGRTSEGQQAIEEAMNTAGGSASVYLKAGQLLLAHGKVEEALKPLGRALNLQPGSDETRLTLALAESRLGRPARVIELLQGHPLMESPLYASLLGSALCDKKDFERAVPLLEQAIRQHANEKPLYLQLAVAYAGLSKGQEAVQTLQRAHARWPDDVQIRSALARQMFLARDAVGALVVLREAPETTLTTEELGLLVEGYAALNRLDEARRYGELAVQRADAPESALIALANVYQLQGRDPDAIALLERRRAKFSSSPRYLFSLAFSYYNRGNYSLSNDLLGDVIARDPKLAPAFYLKGSCLSSLGKPEEALPQFEAAAGLAPNNFLYHFQLGMVLSMLRQKDRAEAELQKSIELNAGHAPAHYELAKIYFGSSRDELARQQLEEAIRVNPEFESSYYLLSRVYARLGKQEDSAATLKHFKKLQQEQREAERALKEASLGGRQQ